MKIALFLAFAISAVLPAAAQDNPTVSALVKHLKTSKAYTLAIAQQMPEDGYSLKPNPAEMSFGEQMNHIASANGMFGTVLQNAKPKHYDKVDKAGAIASLNDSFDNAIAAVSTLKDADLWVTKDTPEGKTTVYDTVLLMLDHTTHHRGQCVVYLRVKGITPTEYQF